MSRRRYRIGLHKIYDTRFDNHKRASQILNPLGNQISWLVFEMSDEHGLASLLVDFKAKLARAEDAVAKADKEFEQLKVTRANEGRTIPKERDQQMEAAYLDRLAEMDVTGEEVDKLEAMLAKHTGKRQAAEASNILRCGPVGTGKTGQGNVLCELDGQKISPNADGILAIDDVGSPYNGMAVEDYKKHLVLPWLNTHGRRGAIDRASLPPWPEDVPRPDPPDLDNGQRSGCLL